MHEWDDIQEIAQATELIRSEPSTAANKALLDLMSLGRVLSDLADDKVWQNPRFALDILRILSILQQSTLFSRDAQSTILSEEQVRHRYYNLHGEYPGVDPGRLLFLLRSANWVQSQRGEPIRLTPLGRRMAGILLRSTNEALGYYQLSRLEQGLFDLRRAQAYAKAYDEQGLDGANTLGEKVAGLVQMAKDLKANLAMSVFRGEVLPHLDTIKAELATVEEEVENALSYPDTARLSPSQLRSLAGEAADAYAVAYGISYEALGEVFRSTSDLGNAPVRRIDETAFLDFLRESAMQADSARPTLMSLVDNGATPEITLWLPVKLHPSADDGLLARGLEALDLAEPPPPSAPLQPVIYADLADANYDDLAVIQGEQAPDDFMAVIAQIATYLGLHGETTLQGIMANLCATVLDIPTYLLGAGHLVKGPQATLRIAVEQPPDSPVTFSEYGLNADGRVLPAGPRVIRVAPSRGLRQKAASP